MSQVAIIVEFKLHKGKQAEFEKLIRAHAERSKSEEPGCVSFDVMQALDEKGEKIEDSIVLTEFYKDREAVKAHESSERMPVLGAAIEPLVESKRLFKAIMI